MATPKPDLEIPTHPRGRLAKAPTGIRGLDDLLEGGLPRGRPTLICGGPGCGKTLLSLQFVLEGIEQYDEPGLFVSFEESPEALAANAVSMDWDLGKLTAEGRLRLHHIHVDPYEIVKAGTYDLSGLFAQIEHAASAIGARRVALDTLELLFSGLSDARLVRSEIKRLFEWLTQKGLTAVVTAERGETTLTRYGLEEYVVDCVIALDHRVTEDVSTRRLRVVKYRGSRHGTNEYPFLMTDEGVVVFPVTAAELGYEVSDARVSSGIPALDAMLEGKGYYRGSTVLVTGTAGTGKSSAAAHFVNAACAGGERALYISSEESPSQLVRNMRSIGLDLERWRQQGLLCYHSARASQYGLEMHLAIVHAHVNRIRPSVLVYDPISGFAPVGSRHQIKAMLMRLIDFLRSEGITAMLTNLSRGGQPLEQTEAAISSLADTWILLRDQELEKERRKAIHIMKSRGMAHSTMIRELRFTPQGIQIDD